MSISNGDFASLLRGYQLCALSEGKSPRSVEAVQEGVTYFVRFLASHGLSIPAASVTAPLIRGYISYLQHKLRYSGHPFTPAANQLLSSHTVNCYARSLRVFFSWLLSEDMIEIHPFEKVKIPRPMKKIIATFSPEQLARLISVINLSRPVGQRDLAMLLLMLDSGLRASELCGLELANLRLEEGVIKVLGKGNKERLIPIGKQVQKLLWHYTGRYRPAPALPTCGYVFLTDDGYPISIGLLEDIYHKYGIKAGITGVRVSPHNFRHTSAVSFLRNGGDVFSLQRLLGHSSLEMTRRYCQLADIDVQRAHQRASPVDNLGLRLTSKKAPANSRAGNRHTKGIYR